jgi:hypothetical protein
MSVALLQSDPNGVTDFIGFALPGAETNCWNFVAGVQSEGFPRGKDQPFLKPCAFLGGHIRGHLGIGHDSTA